ncbi:hypothetical protein K1719_028751 [Acacia pycnantha]|nr:hypothetical protein K1719_041236 [Acacia pycnantha]KAI9090416.1 hypothetical protein K1719_028751 [Acacia pycnantha]
MPAMCAGPSDHVAVVTVCSESLSSSPPALKREDDTKACKLSPASNHQAITFDFYDSPKNSSNPKARGIASSL